MITLANLTLATLLTALALFSLAGILALVWHYQPEKREYQKPKSYSREPESEYQNLIDEHTKK